MPKINLMPWPSQRSNSAVKLKSVSPRKVISPAYGRTNLGGSIDPRHAPFMTDRIARPINQVEHLSSVGQRDNQRRITPDPFVGKPDASFALSQRRKQWCRRYQ